MNTSHEGLLSRPGGESKPEWQARMSSYDDDIEFLKAHHFLQAGLMFDHVMTGVGDIVYGNSDLTDAPAWNNAIPARPDLGIASELDYHYLHGQLKRSAALCIPRSDEFDPVANKLSSQGWIQGPTDEWMTYRGQPLDPSAFLGTVDKVQTGDELDVFLKTLRHAHDDEDSYTNPYGPLSEEQSISIAKAWAKGHGSGRVKYFIVYDSERGTQERLPIAVASLTSWADRFGRRIGHLANVGVNPGRRHHGYGTRAAVSCISEPALAVCVLDSFRQGNVIHSLATEPGKGPREAFLNMDFQTRLIAVIWSRDKGEIVAKSQ
jgi:hypothetical protein